MIGKFLQSGSRIANIARSGMDSVGEAAARKSFAIGKAEDAARATAANYDEYTKLRQDMIPQFEGVKPSNNYTGLDKAVYTVGRGVGKVGGAIGGTVNAMGGPVGVAMTAPMALMFLPPGGSPSEEQPMSQEEALYLQQQAMARQQGYY